MAFYDNAYFAVGIIWLISCVFVVLFFKGAHLEDDDEDDLLAEMENE